MNVLITNEPVLDELIATAEFRVADEGKVKSDFISLNCYLPGI